MADMARVLLTYHFGGIYMDLDFYCFKSFECLEHYILNEINHFDLTMTEKEFSQSNILVVSREPDIHSLYLHHRNRVVIQDFFMSTPKHPFFKWLLDYVNNDFQKKNGQLNNKGPFSYSIQHHLDLYYNLTNMKIIDHADSLYAMREMPQLAATVKPKRRNLVATVNATTASSASSVRPKTNATAVVKAKPGPIKSFNSSAISNRLKLPNTINTTSTWHSPTEQNKSRSKEILLEIKADVLHPLIDSSNQNLAKGCKSETDEEKAAHGLPTLVNACDRLAEGKYLTATEDTMMVHMWTHTYLSK
jgi:hypothetical protein